MSIKRMQSTRPRYWLGLAAIALLSGCVERRMTVRSVPANAMVRLDGREIGHTPVSVPFHYYGERQIQLVKDGYETKTINQTVSTPWYQYIPLDFVSEVLWPWRIRDERDYEYTLEPKSMIPSDQLLERAQATREDGRNPPPDALRKAGLEDMDRPATVPIEP